MPAEWIEDTCWIFNHNLSMHFVSRWTIPNYSGRIRSNYVLMMLMHLLILKDKKVWKYSKGANYY